jgi:hypothetical protein
MRTARKNSRSDLLPRPQPTHRERCGKTRREIVSVRLTSVTEPRLVARQSWSGPLNADELPLAATLASSTHVVTGSGPLAESLRKPGRDPMNPIALPAVFAHAARIPSVGPILSLLECSPPVELALQPQWTFDVGGHAPAKPRRVRRELSRRGV